ncbi:hypothetical protein DYBT9623_02484 [Dyadobacter sp. CECT 9623]|uniref:Uncharacterized protein n=1 Tax=Dyadobacter linearis TaxID=2823330 RepID=A0ABN7RCZ7_9BACT|nr:hypothetical protein [Dyadobacter sp. CECT 9623]CAG5069747.1 hypothetical protein DYBT9623_02484 [Dyadobacter sp. CECT 9623]
MRTTHDSWNRKVPKVKINPALNKYEDMDLFPEKLAHVQEELKNVKLPPRLMPVSEPKH